MMVNVAAIVKELKPDKKYLIFIDKKCFTMKDRHDLETVMDEKGLSSVAALVDGDPTESVTIIEQEQE